MDAYENSHPNEPYEHNMDYWNNNVGREISDSIPLADWLKTDLSQEVYNDLVDGKLISDPHNDTRQWLEPQGSNNDQDGDGIPDNIDPDKDGDGMPNGIDPNPNGLDNGAPDNHTTTPSNPADGKPFDPQSFDPPRRRDPLVLDMNKDGLISTVSLTDSTAFFDLTGDGIKEKVGWVQASEGIVAFDKNGNTKTYERFMGDSRFSSGIESRINATAQAIVNNQNFKKEKVVA